jgi:hypothetical protein
MSPGYEDRETGSEGNCCLPIRNELTTVEAPWVVVTKMVVVLAGSTEVATLIETVVTVLAD